MKNKILSVIAVGAFVLGSSATGAFAQTSPTTATKTDKVQMDKSGKCNDSTTSSPVDSSKSDKPGAATAPKSAGTDNPKTGVDPTKKGAADQTQVNK